MKKIIGLLALMIGVGATAQNPGKFGMEDKDLPKGLAVGTKAPNISLEQLNGEMFSLENALEEGNVVIYFYRGNWCPYCSRQVANLTDSLQMILETGATVVMISPESTDHMKESAAKAQEGIIFLSDAEAKTMMAYDVDFHVTEAYKEKLVKAKEVNIAEFNEQEEAILPVPATYIINQEGEIIYRFFDLNYRLRVTVGAVLKALK